MKYNDPTAADPHSVHPVNPVPPAESPHPAAETASPLTATGSNVIPFKVPQAPPAPSPCRVIPFDGKAENKIAALLYGIGVPVHLKGFLYLRTAILMVSEDRSLLSAVTKRLYPEIARCYETTEQRVERAMRHAIEIAWDREHLKTTEFRDLISGRNKPTNSEFIALIADQLHPNQRA